MENEMRKYLNVNQFFKEGNLENCKLDIIIRYLSNEQVCRHKSDVIHLMYVFTVQVQLI